MFVQRADIAGVGEAEGGNTCVCVCVFDLFGILKWSSMEKRREKVKVKEIVTSVPCKWA